MHNHQRAIKKNNEQKLILSQNQPLVSLCHLDSNIQSTHKNFPFRRWPFWSLGSESSRLIVPWNQGIFSCAVVEMTFSSLGLWLMMACSRAAPWTRRLDELVLHLTCGWIDFSEFIGIINVATLVVKMHVKAKNMIIKASVEGMIKSNSTLCAVYVTHCTLYNI